VESEHLTEELAERMCEIAPLGIDSRVDKDMLWVALDVPTSPTSRFYACPVLNMEGEPDHRPKGIRGRWCKLGYPFLGVTPCLGRTTGSGCRPVQA
jgi:hypothetical protein